MDDSLDYDEWRDQQDYLNDIDAGYIGHSKPDIKVTKLTAIERLQVIQGDWPMKDYMEDGSDSGMHVGDLDVNQE